jgi:hypothetical protein
MDTFVFWPPGGPEEQTRQVQSFAGEVVPTVREAVAKRRKERAASQ